MVGPSADANWGCYDRGAEAFCGSYVWAQHTTCRAEASEEGSDL